MTNEQIYVEYGTWWYSAMEKNKPGKEALELSGQSGV